MVTPQEEFPHFSLYFSCLCAHEFKWQLMPAVNFILLTLPFLLAGRGRNKGIFFSKCLQVIVKITKWRPFDVLNILCYHLWQTIFLYHRGESMDLISIWQNSIEGQTFFCHHSLTNVFTFFPRSQNHSHLRKKICNAWTNNSLNGWRTLCEI